MSKKQIIYITPAMPVGGAERFLLSLSRELKVYTDKQTIINLSKVDTLASEITPDVNYIALPRKSKFDLQPIKSIRRLVKADKPDIIFCINFFTYFVVRCALLGLSRKPQIIISYHSTRHLTRKEHWLHKFYARILQKSDLVVCVSRNQVEYTEKTYGIPRKKFRVILNSVDTNFWVPDSDDAERKAIRSSLGIPDDAKMVVLSAAFRPEKNHLGAVNALKIVHEKHKRKIYLLLVGDGIMRSQIEERIKAHQLQDYVKMPGLQNQVRPYLRSADIFTLCSQNVETFSIAALEAMSCGLPLVMTDVGGASEMVETNVNGLLTTQEDEAIADRWVQALDQPFDKSVIHQYAAKHFGMNRMKTEYVQLMNLTA